VTRRVVEHFPGAMVTGYRSLIESMKSHLLPRAHLGWRATQRRTAQVREDRLVPDESAPRQHRALQPRWRGAVSPRRALWPSGLATSRRGSPGPLRLYNGQRGGPPDHDRAGGALSDQPARPTPLVGRDRRRLPVVVRPGQAAVDPVAAEYQQRPANHQPGLSQLIIARSPVWLSAGIAHGNSERSLPGESGS